MGRLWWKVTWESGIAVLVDEVEEVEGKYTCLVVSVCVEGKARKREKVRSEKGNEEIQKEEWTKGRGRSEGKKGGKEMREGERKHMEEEGEEGEIRSLKRQRRENYEKERR